MLFAMTHIGINHGIANLLPIIPIPSSNTAKLKFKKSNSQLIKSTNKCISPHKYSPGNANMDTQGPITGAAVLLQLVL